MNGIAAGLLVLSLVGCGGDSDGLGGDTIVPPSSSVGEDALVDPLRVVLAGLLLVMGDIELGLAEGLVDVAVVDAARDALDEGNMDAWIQAASEAP